MKWRRRWHRRRARPAKRDRTRERADCRQHERTRAAAEAFAQVCLEARYPGASVAVGTALDDCEGRWVVGAVVRLPGRVERVKVNVGF